MTDRARFATRFLLAAEIVLGFVSLSWALAALVGSGSWTAVMAKSSGMVEWAYILGIVATGQLSVAVTEMCCGRNWSDHALMYFAEARHVFAFVSILAWAVLLFAYWKSPDSIRAVALLMQAAFLILANGVVMVNNKRLSVLLDPKIPTEQLRKRLLEARDSGKMVL